MPGPAADSDSSAAVTALIDAAVARARESWSDVPLADGRLRAELEARLGRQGEEDAPSTLAALHVSDLHLALACQDGHPTAVARLEALYRPAVTAVLGQMRLGDAVIAELLQALRVEIFVGARSGVADIARYTGRGPLKSWACVVATHLALRTKRELARGPRDIADFPSLSSAGRDPELELLRRTYGAAVPAAFQEALHALTPRERLLLKQRFRHELELTELGTLYGVHASTVSRWVASARDNLVTGTRDRLIFQLGISRAEVSSVLRLARSEVDLTLESGIGLAGGPDQEAEGRS